MSEGVFGVEVRVDEARVHHIRRDVIGSLAVYGVSVDYDLEIGSFAIELDRANTVNELSLVEAVAVSE